MYIKDVDLFVAVQLLEDTPPVLSLGEPCQDHGNSCEWIVGHKPHLIKKRQEDTMQYRELRSDGCSWSVEWELPVPA